MHAFLIFDLSYLIPWPAPQAVWVKLIDVEDMDGTFNAQMMELTGDFQEQEIVLRDKNITFS